MISKIDTTAYFLTLICEEILSTLTHRIDTDSIYELVKGCIISNKEQTGLEGFWIESGDHRFKDFWVELHFKDEDDSFRIGFSNKDSADGFYRVIDVNPFLIVTRPLSLKFDGLMCCSPYQSFLYVDYFTKWVPLDDEDNYLSVHDLIEGNRNDIDYTKKDRFTSFYERLSEREKEEMGVANIDVWNLDDKESHNYNYLLSRIYNENISCVVTSDTQISSLLKSILPSYISLIMYNGHIPSLSKHQWVYRAVIQIKQLLTNEQQDLQHRSNDYWRWLSVMIKYYKIPKYMMREACGQFLTRQELFYIHKYGYL